MSPVFTSYTDGRKWSVNPKYVTVVYQHKRKPGDVSLTTIVMEHRSIIDFQVQMEIGEVLALLEQKSQ